MYKPAATIRILKERFYGPAAVERRVYRCCADNPDCPIGQECRAEYDAYINSLSPKKSSVVFQGVL